MNDINTAYEMRIRRNRERRNRQLRRHIAMLVAAAGFILSLTVFGLNAVSSNASDDDAPVVYKYYRSVAVLPSDTVQGYAEACLSVHPAGVDTDIERLSAEIRSINHLEEDETPLAGTRLIVPYYSYEFR